VNHTITFDDETGREWTLPVTGGHVKLQWKPDFGARWAALDVDFEMYGKDHSTNTPIYDGICEVLGGRKPEHFTYELFLGRARPEDLEIQGQRADDRRMADLCGDESLSYFMYQKPKTAKRMYFDVIPKAVDEYHQQLRAYPRSDVDQQAERTRSGISTMASRRHRTWWCRSRCC
jgi:lysyl-tRNA synthetase class 1